MKRNILTIMLLCAIPSVVHANAGTPLMWAGMFHLIFGNLLIGIFEGILLAKIFHLSKLKCIGLLILANYFSAWVETNKYLRLNIITIQKDFASIATPSWRDINTKPHQYKGSWFNFGQVPKLGVAQSSPWEFGTGCWPIEGLHGTKKNSKKQKKWYKN